VEEQFEEEQAIAGSPPKMLPPSFPMNAAGTALANNPPVPSNEQAQGEQQGATASKAAPPTPMPEQQQQEGQEGKVGAE
jgi:hypothetical protein